MSSVRRTHRALIVDEGWRSGESRRRSLHAHRRAGLLRPRRAGGARVHRGSSDALSAPSRGRGAAESRAYRRRGTQAHRVNRIDFRMPALGADMESATLTQWLKKPGEPIRRGEAICRRRNDQGPHRHRVLRHRSRGGAPRAARCHRSGRRGNGAHRERGARRNSCAVSRPRARHRRPPRGQLQVRPLQPRLRACASRRPHVIVQASSASTSPKCRAAVRTVSCDSRTSSNSQRLRLRPRRGSTCAPRSGPRWLAPSARSHTTISRTRSISAPPVTGWPNSMRTVPVEERLLDAVLLVKAVALAAARTRASTATSVTAGSSARPTVNVGTAIALRGGGLVAPALLRRRSQGPANADARVQRPGDARAHRPHALERGHLGYDHAHESRRRGGRCAVPDHQSASGGHRRRRERWRSGPG